MIEIKDRRILIDGKPRLLIGGEVHYFRLKREEWQDRIDKLKAAGCNVLASYIPWLCHEPFEGQVDLTGKTRPELDLGAFIDLCKENGLYFFARPGPFIMAEMKNEGLPYWVYDKHPEIVPVSWDGKIVPTRTVDYLAPGFLEEARHWYGEVMPVLASRLYSEGGNIIGVQLDNEIGMLSWVTNCPDLTDNVLDDFVRWLHEQYDPATLEVRYPFVLDNEEIRDTELRSPKEEFAAEFMRDLGHYMRNRFARYVSALRGYAEEFGVKDVPFIINVHGTDQGRGFSFPIGISQLYEAYTQAPGYLAGSDHYVGDLTVRNFQDLYLINALMEAVSRPEQPLASVEFEAGSGDYGNSYGARLDPASADFKTRMCVAQGNRLLNYYLFTGGINYHLPEPVHDGNDRISFTGERHGTAAPVSPEGELNYTYPRLARSVKTMMAVGDKLAAMDEELDNVAFAFIPDYYMTEYRYPESGTMNAIAQNLSEDRGPGAWEVVVKAMLFACYRFTSIDIQDKPLDPQSTPVLVLASARYMDAGVQQKLVDYLQAGGHLLMYGEVPLSDMEGKPCALLADALGLKPAGSRSASRNYYLSVHADGWVAPRPEVPTHFAQVFEPARGQVLLRIVGTEEACGVDVEVGRGRAVVVTCSYVCDVPMWTQILESLDATARLCHDNPRHGIFLTSCASAEGERFVHILNLDTFDKEVHLSDDGQTLLGGRAMTLHAREGVMLPLNVSFGPVKVLYSTAEIASVNDNCIEFRLTQDRDVIALQTDRDVATSDDYEISRENGLTLVTSRKRAVVDDRLAIRWR